MDSNFEKDLLATRLKASGLNHRTQSMLVLAELLNEYMQLVAVQQKQIDQLLAQVKSYEDPNSAGKPVPSAPR